MKRKASRLGAWTAAGITALVVLAIVMFARVPRTEYRHPHPRPDVTADGVVRDFMLGGFSEAKPAYAVARAIPAVLDGLHCYCNCSMSIGHRSLLSCFEDLHGTGCDICQLQAQMAAEGFAAGRSLEDIRAGIDAAYGGG